MRRAFEFWRRSRSMIRRDVDEELEFHLQARAEALVALGRSPADARAEALREFGDLDDARTYLRSVDRDIEQQRRRRDLVSDLRQDLAYALRMLRRAPTFTLTAILTIALGVGANTAIFSVVHGIVFKPLPFPDPEQLVRMWSANPESEARQTPVSPPDLDDWRAQRTQFADIGGYWFADGGSGVDLTGSGDPQRLSVAFVTAGYFPALGVRAAVGRLPREDEMVRGGDDRVVVLSHGFWRSRFGADSSIVTRTLTLNDAPYRVVGVMQPDLHLPSPRVEAFIPYSSIPDESIPYIRPVRVLDVIGRLKPGASLAQGQQEMNAIAARLAETYPNSNRHYTEVTVTPLTDAITGGVRQGLVALLGAVGFVLLMACVNVASLLLARSTIREREVALRLSLGATRGRLVRQMITESVLLSLLGGAVGLVGAVFGTRALVALAAGQLPRTTEVALDATVLLFALAVSLGTGLLFGLAPAVRAAGTDLQSSLREAGRGLVSGAAHRLRTGLVVMEVALAVVLIIGAGLMTRSFVQLLRVDLGFQPQQRLAVNFTISTERHGEGYRNYYRQVIDRVRTVPGVVSAGAVKHAPFRGNGERQSFLPEGMTLGPGDQAPTAAFIHVSDGYFATIGARVLQGREYDVTDGAPGQPRPDNLPGFLSAAPTLLVNRALADRYFPGGTAVGKTLRIGGAVRMPIIGVIDDIKQVAVEEPAQPTVYINNMMNSRVQVTLVVKTAGAPLGMANAVRDAIWSVDPQQTITSITTFDQLAGDAVARPRLLTVLLGLFGALGLVLGAVGLYGVLAYLVSSRQREIGVRIALGAPRGAVLGMVVRRGVGMALAGIAIGVVAAVGLTRYLRDVLFGVAPTDWVTYAGVVTAMLAVAALASLVPARRAATVDPAIAFRAD